METKTAKAEAPGHEMSKHSRETGTKTDTKLFAKYSDFSKGDYK